MPPSCAGRFAGFPDDARQNGVCLQAVGFVVFARVDVRFAGVAGGVDQEGCPGISDQPEQRIALGVVKFAPRNAAVGRGARLEQLRERSADVSGRAEQEDDGRSRG